MLRTLAELETEGVHGLVTVLIFRLQRDKNQYPFYSWQGYQGGIQILDRSCY